MTDYIEIGKELGLPLILGLLGYLGGRKSTSEKKSIELETLKNEFSLEIESLRQFRELLVIDNKSLKDELKETQVQNKELKLLVNSLEDKCKSLSNELKKMNDLICLNTNICKNKKTE